MKRGLMTIVLGAGLLLFGAGCAAPGAGLIGTWEMVDDRGEATGATKIIAADHFAFGTMRGENEVWAGGGTWGLSDGVYFETIEYHSMSVLVGRTVKFEYSLEDGLWHHQGSFRAGGMDLNIDETWRKVKKD